jgi:hypothetical protein
LKIKLFQPVCIWSIFLSACLFFVFVIRSGFRSLWKCKNYSKQ